MIKLFTPRTPRPTFPAIVFMCSLLFCHLGKAQEISLQQMHVYEASLKEFHRQQVAADSVEYASVTRKKWWYYLPSVGIQFGLPSVQFGTGTLARIDADKQKNRAKLDAIKVAALLRYRTELAQLRTMYKTVLIGLELAADIPVLNKLESNLLTIADEANRQQKISPAEHNAAVMTFQHQQLAHDAVYRKNRLAVLELEQFARFGFPVETLD